MCDVSGRKIIMNHEPLLQFLQVVGEAGGEEYGSLVPEMDVVLEEVGTVGVEPRGVVVEERDGELGGETAKDVVVVW